MKIKVFYPDRDGRIHFTKEELQALLDEVYREGYNDARPYYWTSPYYWSNTGNGTITTGSPLRGDSITNITYTTADSSGITYATNSTSTPTAGQTLTYNGGDIPEPQSYQIKFETAET